MPTPAPARRAACRPDLRTARHRSGRRSARRSGRYASDVASAVLPGALLALALSAWRFSAVPLWRDEWITWSVVVRPWGSMVALLSERDGGLWPFYAAMHAWMLVDDSVAWMRVPSGLATVVAVVVTALVGRRVAGPLAGALSGVVLAILPAVVAHAQQARAYPEVMALAALTALAALRWRAAPTPGRTAALAVVAAATVAAHPLPGVPAVAGLIAALLASPGAGRRPAAALAGAPAALLAGVLVAVGARQVGLVLTDAPGGLETLARFRLVLAPRWWTLWLLAALAVAGARWVWHRGRGSSLLLLAWAAAPPLVLAGLVAAGSFSTRRYLVAGLPAVAVLVATGAVALGAVVASTVAARAGVAGAGVSSAGARRAGQPWVAPTVALALVAVVVAALAPGAIARRTAPYAGDDPRSAAHHVAAHQRAGDVVVHGGPFARGMTGFYAPAGTVPADPLLASDRLASDTVDGVDLPAEAQRAAVAGAPRLWVVATHDGAALEGAETIDRVTAGRARLEQESFGNVVVQLWGPPGP